MTDIGYQEVEKLLSEAIGLDPEALGSRSIAHAVDDAVRAAGIEGVNEYVAALKSGRGSLDELLERVVVPETWFFRDSESFSCLRAHVEEKGFLARERGVLRLLSAPCSTGEEPYSIAMALLEMGLSPERFRVDAVDISATAIETAKRAVYGKGSFRGEGAAPYERYFIRTEAGSRVDPAVAGLVHFYRDNLALPECLQHHECYDVIFCKNLLIYLTGSAREQVIANLDRLLVPHGLLFAGNSEVVTFLQHGYRPVRHARSFACRKTGEPLWEPPALPPAPRPKKPPARAREAREPLPFKREQPSDPVQRVAGDASLHEIRMLADRGALQDALNRCEQFLAENLHHKEGYFLMGIIHFALNSFGLAEEFFQKVLYLDPNHYETLVQMGLLYEKKGDLAKASVIRDRIGRIRVRDANGREST